MNKYDDGLICGICKGKRVIEEVAGKNMICPRCKGSGKMNNTDSDLNEDGSAKRKPSLILG